MNASNTLSSYSKYRGTVSANVVIRRSPGVMNAATRRTVARCPAARVAELGRAGFRFLWIDPEIGDGLRNEVRTVLLAEGERV